MNCVFNDNHVPVIDFKEDCTDSYLKQYFGLTDEEYKNIFC